MVLTRNQKRKNIEVEPVSHIELIVSKKQRKRCDSIEESTTSETSENCDPYEQFLEHLNDIMSGDFFERTSFEQEIKDLKKRFSISDIESFNSKLDNLRKIYKTNAPNVIDIITKESSEYLQQDLLEKLHMYYNSEILSDDYNYNLKAILNKTHATNIDQNLQELEQSIIDANNYCDNYKTKILSSDMPFDNKVIAYKRYEIMERYEHSDSSEYAKYKNWLDILLSVPFGKYIKTPSSQSYLSNVRNLLDKRLSFLEEPKDQIINIIAQMLRNNNCTINAIGLYGCKGVGKTKIVQSLAEALGRPFRSISLGGESDTSLLTGHGFTYIGSSPGRIIDILNETKCMNPVILFDEVDKVSESHYGKEIIGTLIHLTDATTNAKYNYDRYFSGIEFDLSKALFVFTYNDQTKVDKILADRLFQIKVDNYSFKEKFEIAKKHIISDVLQKFSFTKEDITFSDEAIQYIISLSSSDEGMRDIQRKFDVIVSRINTLMCTNRDDNVIKLQYKSLYEFYSQFPIDVKKEHIDILLSQSPCIKTDTSLPPYGMYV
jgi:ATP-dependent Lon protease